MVTFDIQCVKDNKGLLIVLKKLLLLYMMAFMGDQTRQRK